MLAQSMGTKGASRRLPQAWMASARWSLPLPDSPRRRMLTSRSTTFSSVSRSARMAALRVRTKSLRRGSRRLARISRRRGVFVAPSEAVGSFCKFSGDVRRIAPQSLQPVKPPRLLGEDMEDEVAIVEEHPMAGRGPLDEQRLRAVLQTQPLLHVAGDRRRLPLVAGRAEAEVVSNRRQGAYRQDVEIERLLVEGGADRGTNSLLHLLLNGICHV